MFRTIFAKQLFACMSAVLISFLILGFALVSLFENFFISQKTDDLKSQCRMAEIAIAKHYSSPFEINTYGIMPNFLVEQRVSRFKEDLATLYEFTGMSFFVIEKSYVESGVPTYFVIHTSDIQLDKIEYAFSNGLKSASERVFDGETVIVRGNLAGIYGENMISVGYPVISGEQTEAMIFM
ncbi:MAG: hypothetical protein LBM16_05205, partial [Clostridiales bacterium]|nr:hypothetical protein [Clostridiales bacterium]